MDKETGKVKKITEDNGFRRFKKILVVVIFVLITLFLITTYSHFHGEIKDAKTLSSRVEKALERTRSYQFNLSSNLSMFNEDLQVMWVEGRVNSNENKLHLSIDSADRSMEAIIIGDKAYIRENNGSWQSRDLGDSGIWKDKLSEHRAILSTAKNLTMYRENGGWLLEIIPEKEEVMEQMRSMGLETSGTGLQSYVIRYWIESETFRIKKIETYADVEMNVRGMQTVIKSSSVIHLSNYNEKMIIKAPIQAVKKI